VRITASAGSVLVPPSCSTSGEALLEQADAAMYKAKRSGPGRSAAFTTSMREAALQRLDVETELRTALERQQFHLAYQPIVHALTREVVGHEALVRWSHPQRGMVPPIDSSRSPSRPARSWSSAAGCCTRRVRSCVVGTTPTASPGP
jgi:predicted signal transduction protein with EAL and GGDEF domain